MKRNPRHPTITTRRTASALVVAALVLAACSPSDEDPVTEPERTAEIDALGDDPGSTDDETEADDLAELESALREAAAAYANDFDVSEDEAVRRLRQQQALQDTLAAVEEALGEDYAGAYVEHQPEVRGVVRVVEGSGSMADVRALIERSQESIDVVEVDGPGVPALLRNLTEVLPELVERGGGLGGAEVDERTGEFVLYYQPIDRTELDDDATARVREDRRGASRSSAAAS